MEEQITLFKSGNDLAALAIKQINYDVMGYFPITPSTQIAEEVDLYRASGQTDITLVPAEGEHSALGVCYGSSVAGGRVVSATSANGLLYAIEQLPVFSGTRFPMVLNVACRTVSGPLSIKGDHSDIMYTLNSGFITLYANTPQEVYDFNIIGLKIAESLMLPVIVAFDGFFTSHQKNKVSVFKNDESVRNFIGKYNPPYTCLDTNNPVTIGSYMNEPDIINNKYQLHLAMEDGLEKIPEIFNDYSNLSQRKYHPVRKYKTEDAKIIVFALGSAYGTILDAVDNLRQKDIKVGAFSLCVLRPSFKKEISEVCKNAEKIILLDRQDSYGFSGGNMSTEIKSILKDFNNTSKVITKIYGLGGLDFYVEDAEKLILDCINDKDNFDYIGKYKGNEKSFEQYFNPVTDTPDVSFKIKDTSKMPKRLVAGHGACPGCGIPVNINLLLKGIEGEVVLLFQTGCGMVVSTSYPKNSFRVNYVHNLFQNGGATLSGIVEAYNQKIKKGELSSDITFIMVSGDGGLDIGLGSALAAAIRGHHLIIFEYDNGGYMNTGYQLSYSTPMGAKSSTSHLGDFSTGKTFLQKDNPQIFAATNMPYVATVAESHIQDFVKKASKAQYYAKNYGVSYIKALSACPLNWNDNPRYERGVIEKAVKSCYHPLYEVEKGITTLTFNPIEKNQKLPVMEYLKSMGRTKHLSNHPEIVNQLQTEIDQRFQKLIEKHNNPLL